MPTYLFLSSLSQLVRWMSVKAEELGVEVYPGFAASEVPSFLTLFQLRNTFVEGLIFASILLWQILYDENQMVAGVATNDVGIAKDGSKRETFQPGVELRGE